MAGRPVRAEGARRSALEQQVDHLHRSAGGVQRAPRTSPVLTTVSTSRCRRRSRSTRSIESMYAVECTASKTARSTGSDKTRSNPSQSRADNSRSIATSRAARSGCAAGVVAERRGMLEPHGRGSHRDTVSGQVRVLANQVTVVGAGAAGLYTALRAAARGRDGDARVGHAAGGVLELLGAGRAGRRARRAGQPRASPARHGDRGPRRGARVGRARPVRGGARARSGPDAARRPLRRRPRRSPGAGARGRPLGAPDRPRRRRGDRPADHPPAVSAVVAEHPAIDGPRGPARDRAARPTTGAASASDSTTAAAIAGGAAVLATGGAAALWARTTNPVGRDRRRAAARPSPPAPRSPISSWSSSTPPRSSAPTAPTGSSSPRRSAARAPCCSTHAASGSSTSSRPATRWRAPSNGRWR